MAQNLANSERHKPSSRLNARKELLCLKLGSLSATSSYMRIIVSYDTSLSIPLEEGILLRAASQTVRASAIVSTVLDCRGQRKKQQRNDCGKNRGHAGSG